MALALVACAIIRPAAGNTVEGAWSPDVGFDAGVWRFDFLWDGRKIGEREFVISA